MKDFTPDCRSGIFGTPAIYFVTVINCVSFEKKNITSVGVQLMLKYARKYSSKYSILQRNERKTIIK